MQRYCDPPRADRNIIAMPILIQFAVFFLGGLIAIGTHMDRLDTFFLGWVAYILAEALNEKFKS